MRDKQVGNDRFRTLVILAVSLLTAPCFQSTLVAESLAPRTIDFRAEWRFSKSAQPGADEPKFDDSSWATIRLPHDWAIAEPFDPDLEGATAKLPWRGVGWYRKTFELHCEPRDRVYLDFDGVMGITTVYINGKPAGDWNYGYTSFRIDASPFINRDGTNVVAVRVDTRPLVSRWYPGAGIYRKVTLQLRKPVHLGHWSTFVTTPQISDAAAKVQARTIVENHNDTQTRVNVLFTFRHPDGHVLHQDSQPLTIPPSAEKEISVTADLPQPQRWDVDSPRLYTLEVAVVPESTLSANDAANLGFIDFETTTFGIRQFEFTANDGFHLNGRRVQLKGVNLHHDHGPLGAAFYTRAMQRQLEIMKDMGVNAVRTSHNTPAPELLELCDRMGILVWDECFDKWNETAGRIDGQPSHEDHARRHLRSMVTRDRNHPSVVVWSIGNEIPVDGEGLTEDRVTMMRNVIREFDDTRPVTLGCHEPHTAETQILDALDLTGWNYARRYDRYRERYPDRPIIYSESASALSTRGFYELPLPKTKTDYSTTQQVSSYDFNAAPWSDIADAEFKLMEEDDFVAGEFVWTGFDYLGEPTPFEQQAKSSYFGIVDLCGIPKDRFYLYRSYWRLEKTTVHILPHWNWPDRIGKPVPVFVYTNGDAAELFLNGKSFGIRKKQQSKRPQNLAARRAVSASSQQSKHPAEAAVDDLLETFWQARPDDAAPRFDVDLGKVETLRCFILEFEQEAKHYGYVIRTSSDGQSWIDAVRQRPSQQPRWGGPKTAVHDLDVAAQFVQIQFDTAPLNSSAALREFGAYSQLAEARYYEPIYRYRLRWDDVTYQPGELKAVAFKDGQKIGNAVMRTAGDPAAIRLTPDRKHLAASGDDLAYILVEAIDEDGNLCPLADNPITFEIEGPAAISGVGNGNPLSLEPFQANRIRLFYGKAMLIVQPNSGPGGTIAITAASPGLSNSTIECASAPPAR